ncbi:MAG: LamG-like jellyroll fold domain-containing protein [Candidatus Moraniibacteriota bacterium]|jgi:concanavalin A-like lectin/glucanase superfamily protein
MKNKRGSVLVFALIILSFILVSAFSLSSVALMERRSSNASVNSSTAFQKSDKGMEEFLQQIYKELDQNNTLTDVGDALNTAYGYGVDGEYKCIDETSATGVADQAARIGSKNTDFIITAYQEVTGGQWTTIPEIKDCNAMLADVSRFRATGNYNSTARAVFLKLRDSLTRGLVAHWSFEDRAHIARVISESERENRISFLAQDYSKQGHALTLCGLKVSNSGDTEIDVMVPSGDASDPVEKQIVEFDTCQADDVNGMNPKRGYDDNGDDEYDANGSWEQGVVEELVTAIGDVHNDTSNSEALRFNGTDTYLSTYFDSSCVVDEVNCVSDMEDMLKVDDGIAISLWVNTNDDDGVLVSRRNDSDEGYELSVVGGNICMDVDSERRCTKTSIDVPDEDWHHIVARWRSNDGNIEIFIDGEDQTNGTVSNVVDMSDMPNTLFIGASDHDEDLNPPTMENYFEGLIDDIRIWNRSLTQNEICRICNTAENGSSQTDCNSTICP